MTRIQSGDLLLTRMCDLSALQEATSAEWVVVDDGSTENTAILMGTIERLRTLFGVHITFLRNEVAEVR